MKFIALIKMGNFVLYIAFIIKRIISAFYLLAKTCNKHIYVYIYIYIYL